MELLSELLDLLLLLRARLLLRVELLAEIPGLLLLLRELLLGCLELLSRLLLLGLGLLEAEINLAG